MNYELGSGKWEVGSGEVGWGVWGGCGVGEVGCGVWVWGVGWGSGEVGCGVWGVGCGVWGE
ncbi:hypothetical protein [Microcystis viridis]|uniref:hypothetical protein n=1 Tax=Microcystis viridis TaxID=44822 RepID=UPI0013DDE133|nr:hypothetical protein [Microcystis viridis]